MHVRSWNHLSLLRPFSSFLLLLIFSPFQQWRRKSQLWRQLTGFEMFYLTFQFICKKKKNNLCLYYVIWDICVFFRTHKNPQSLMRFNFILFRCRDLLIKDLKKVLRSLFLGDRWSRQSKVCELIWRRKWDRDKKRRREFSKRKTGTAWKKKIS